MNTLKTIKDKLIDNLNNSLQILNDEELNTVKNIKLTGVQSSINRIMEIKSFKNLNLLTHAVRLRSANEEIKIQIQNKNLEIFRECFNIPNTLTFQKVINKYFEQPDTNLKTINSMADIDYYIEEFNGTRYPDGKFTILMLYNKDYINPYTNSIVKITNIGVGSNMYTLINPADRLLESVLNFDFKNQYLILSNSDKTYSGLSKYFDTNQINKFDTEFVIFHELAHSSITQYNKSGRLNESVSDVCAALRVIKNNNMSIAQAVDYIDHRISFRSDISIFDELTLAGYQEENNYGAYQRIHSTQMSLLALKTLITNEFDFVKSLTIVEELFISSNLSLTAISRDALMNFKEKHFSRSRHVENISLDNWLQNETIDNYLNNLAINRNTAKEGLVKNLKENLFGQPDKMFDIMTAYYKIADPLELKKLESYSLTSNVKDLLTEHKKTEIDLELNINFTKKELNEVIEKQTKIRPKI